MTSLQPTRRTTITREKERAVHERDELVAFLRASLVAHVGIVADGHPVVLPSTYAVDVDGPDEAGTLYLHGSVGAGWLRRSPDAQVCVTVTEVDGLVIARSGFHHSMNYRSAVVIGTARLVSDEAERFHALDLIVDHVVPGRSATLRPATRKELAATTVLAVSLAEASMKARSGPPSDDVEDIEAGVWAGVLPLRIVAGEIEPDVDATGSV
ncbi:MAG: pyridoxamine 5-phosphate oxidase family protein, partial [Nocardioidaceae bacterium]|nr:pyridoxamine 5-phosphate oxidase family protein [Nocardioidaceae bacterium]